MKRLALALVAGLAGCRASSVVAPKLQPRSPPAWPTSIQGLTVEQVAEASGLVHDACLSCHSAEMIQQQRLTRAQWEATLKKMRRFGAAVADDQEGPLLDVLSTAFGSQAPAYQPALVEHPEDAVAPLPDGPLASSDATSGAAVYGHHCAGCHGEDARGKVLTDDEQSIGLGVNLIDRPLLYRAPQFARTVRAGRGRMPAFEHLTDAEIGQLLAYLRVKE